MRVRNILFGFGFLDRQERMSDITTQNNKRKVHRFGVLVYWVVILKILLSWGKKVRARNILFGLGFLDLQEKNVQYNNPK